MPGVFKLSFRWSALAAAALSATAAAASSPASGQQPRQSPEAQAIVVTGTRTSRQAIERYVDGLTVDTNGQIATFQNPICPASFGLPDAFKRVVEQRIRDDAARVGLRVAGKNCDANVAVITADHPARLITALEHKRPDLFVGVDYSDVRAILDQKGPVHTWQAVESRGSDGRPLRRVQIVVYNGQPIYLGGAGALINTAPANSRVQQSIRPDLVMSFVVLDADAVDGLTLTQIADYAAMRTLARTHSTQGVGGRSILGVIGGAPENRTVEQLTEWDLAYLKALYRTSNTVAARMQQDSIASTMDRELRGPER